MIVSIYVTSPIIIHKMDLKIAGKCFIKQGSDLIVDSAGNRIPAKLVIFFKKTAFVIPKDGNINKFSGQEMDVIYQAADEDFNFFEAQVRKLDIKRNQSIITSILGPLQVQGARLEEGNLLVF